MQIYTFSSYVYSHNIHLNWKAEAASEYLILTVLFLSMQLIWKIFFLASVPKKTKDIFGRAQAPPNNSIAPTPPWSSFTVDLNSHKTVLESSSYNLD